MLIEKNLSYGNILKIKISLVKLWFSKCYHRINFFLSIFFSTVVRSPLDNIMKDHSSLCRDLKWLYRPGILQMHFLNQSEALWRTEDYFLSNHNYIHSTFRWRLRLRRRRDYRYEANWIGYITNPLPTLFEDQSVGWRDLVITPSCINLQYRLLATKLGENRFEKVTSLRKK